MNKLTMSIYVIFAFVLTINYTSLVFAKSCSKNNDCSCTTDGGTVIDLSSLANNDNTPRFPDTPDPVSGSEYYSYNPCNKFTEGSCADVALCLVQSTGPISQYKSIGTQDSSTFQFDDKGDLTIQYSTDSDKSIVELICEEGNTGGTFVPLKTEKGTYFFQLKSEYVCINERISVGTILCISLAVVLVVYFGFGILIQIFIRKKSGKDIVPNSSFWTALPFLIVDGAKFVKTRGKASTYQKI